MSRAPIICTWTGEAFEPTRRYHNQVNAEFVVGERYQVEVLAGRSDASHRHFFARVTEMWMSLPEGAEDTFPTPEHLRKRALIMTGFRDERSIVCASRAEALRLRAFIKPMDDFAVVTVHEQTVVVLTAKSQSKAAMGAEVFQKSKTAVLDYVEAMLERRAA